MVDDVENFPIGVVTPHGSPTDREVDLLRVVVDAKAFAVGTRQTAGHPPVTVGQIGKGRGDDLDDVVVVDLAGDGDDRRTGRVVVDVEPADVVGGDRAHRVAIARGVTAEPMVGEQLPRQRAQGDVVGRVVVHRQLLEDDLSLTLDVVVLQRRSGENVAQQFDARPSVASGHPAVERRVLLRREGVDVAAHAVDGAGDVGRRAGRRPLEQQVLQKVTDAGLLGGLVTGADADPDADRYRPRPGTRSVATVNPLSSCVIRSVT